MLTELHIQFQGGFACRDCEVSTLDREGKNERHLTHFHPSDSNSVQVSSFIVCYMLCRRLYVCLAVMCCRHIRESVEWRCRDDHAKQEVPSAILSRILAQSCITPLPGCIPTLPFIQVNDFYICIIIME